MEYALHADFAIVKAWKGIRWGTCLPEDDPQLLYLDGQGGKHHHR